MEKRAVIAGATGMIGSLVLKNCLESNNIEHVVSLVRKSSGEKHSKKTEVEIDNFEDYSHQANLFKNIDVAFFCVGVYSGNVSDTDFRKVTFNYAIAFAEAVEKNSPSANLCLLSGMGADRTGKSKTAFAKYKGMAETSISTMMPKRFFTFRPGYIYPVLKRKEPNFGYTIARFLYPALKLLGKKFSIKSTELAEAMFKVGLHGTSKEILENLDILDMVTAYSNSVSESP